MAFKKYINFVCLSFFFLVIFFWFYKFLSPELLAEDLPAHAEISRRMLSAGRLIFYDTYWFSGWPAFQFYGFLPHLLVAITAKLTVGNFSAEALIRFYALLAAALLPASFYFAVSSIKKESSLILAILSGFVSIWFLLVDESFYGVGIDTIYGIGLFPQIFGWHFVLIGLGLLLKNSKSIAIVIALSLVTHTLSAFFLIIITVLWFLIFSEQRKNILISLTLALGMMAFWLYPFLSFNSEFSSADVYQNSRDWLSLLLRYPITSIKPAGLFLGQYDFFRIIFVIALLSLFNKKLHTEKSIALTIIVLILSIIASSNFIAASNPLAMHYYRISGLIILPILILISFILNQICTKNKKVFGVILSILLVASTVNLLRLNPTVINSGKIDNDLTSVTEYLKNSSGRIFVEFNSNYKEVPQASAHYIESKLTPNEVINGLFVESSNLNRYLAFTTEMLEGSSFHGYLLFTEGVDIDKKLALEQFKSLGVSKIVASSKAFTNNLEQLVGQAIFTAGIYKVYEILPAAKLSEVNKPVVAYLDLSKKLPFKIVSQYFYSNSKLFSNYELINLNFNIPANISYLMINGEKNKIIEFLNRNKTSAKIIPFYEKAELVFSHQTKYYRVDNKVEEYKKVKKFFDTKLKIKDLLNDNAVETTNTELAVEVRNDGSFVFNNLLKDKIYKLNYSYSPLLNGEHLAIFRGLAERIYIIPESDGNLNIKFSLFNLAYYAFSIIFSIASLIAFIIYRKTNV